MLLRAALPAGRAALRCSASPLMQPSLGAAPAARPPLFSSTAARHASAAAAKRSKVKAPKAAPAAPEGEHIILWDAETTGLNNKRDQFVELAFLHPMSGETLELMVRPTTARVSGESEAVHGISNKMLEDAPTFEESWDDVHSWIHQMCGGAPETPVVLLSHFATSLDIPMLQAELNRAGKQLPEHFVMACSSGMIRARLPKKTPLNLNALVSMHGVEGGTAHRALADVRALWGVLQGVFPEETLSTVSRNLQLKKLKKKSEKASKPKKSNGMWWKWRKSSSAA